MICFVVATYFFGGSQSSYGNRLEGIEKNKITSTIKNKYISTLEENELVNEATVRTSGKVVYIKIKFQADITLIEAKSIAVASLTNLTENILGYYDLNFTLTSPESENSEGFTIMGSKKNETTNIAWNNNTVFEEESE